MKIETLNPIKIQISGLESFDFLQNLITNDLKKIVTSINSYILTPQGKIYYDIQINKLEDGYEIFCSHDQSNFFTFFEKYSRLSEVELKIIEISQLESNYILHKLSKGIIDANILPQGTVLPSEVYDNYVDYQKGCYIGQEVVSRIKHRQLTKKIIKVYEFDKNDYEIIKNLEVLFEFRNYLIIRFSIDDFKNESFLKYNLKLIN